MSFRAKPVPLGRLAATLACCAALALVAVGCGSDGSSGQDSTTTAEGYTPLTSAPRETTGPSTTSAGSADGTVTTTRPGETSTSPSGSATSPTSPGADALLPPSGTFLSSHKLSLSGTGAPSNARSVCRTSPGASCWLTFSNDGRNVSFLAEKVDASGVATWDWSPTDIQLTIGHWDVTVTAERGSEQQVVEEAIGLDVVA